MKFSVGLPGLSRYPAASSPWHAQVTAPRFQEIAHRIDQMNYTSIAAPEHLVLPKSLEAAMGAFWPHAFTVMAFVAGATRRVRVDASVLILPYYHPVNLAKAVSTLDMLCGGRVTLSIGVGHARGEFEALGVSFEERGRIADEYLEAMRVLWTEDEPVFQGRYVSFKDIAFEPKPVQKPYPPLWVGGNSRPAMRRAVKYGVGWNPWLITVEELPGCMDYMRSLPEWSRREAPLELWLPVQNLEVDELHRPDKPGSTGAPEKRLRRNELIDAVGRLRDAGVTWTGLPVDGARSCEEWLDKLEELSEEVIPLFG